MLDKKKEKQEWQLFYLFIMLMSAGIFMLVYGVNVLNPCYDDWLLGRGDLTQHYLGWVFYRKTDWKFPIGLTNQLAYPLDSSVIFTDSIPLLAVFFKIFSAFLPETFQYFGWWGILSFMLQGLFTAKILREFGVGKRPIVLASILFVLSPTVIEKMFRHTALGGHWIILFSIFLFVRHRRGYQDVLRSSIQWGMVGFLIGSIHLYYLPMCGMILAGYIFCSILCERRIRLKHLMPGIAFTIALFVTTYLLGGFSTKAESGSDGLGYYSFNLNGFFNSKGYSRFLPSLTMYQEGQYEGFAYLGLGVFVLLFFAILYLIFRTVGRKPDAMAVMYGVVYGLISLGLIILAASPQVSFGDKLLFEFPDIDMIIDYWTIFRSSGRLVWPVCYLLFMGAVVGCERFCKQYIHSEKIAILIIAACTALQVYDLSSKLGGQNDTFAPKITYESIMEDELWDKLEQVESLEHVVWVSHNLDTPKVLAMAKFAADHDLTMNNFYFARGINVNEYTKESMNNLNESCVYIFRPEEPERLAEYDLNYYEVDGYIVGTVFTLED